MVCEHGCSYSWFLEDLINPQHLHDSSQLSATVPEVPNALFWPPWTSDVHVVDRHICRQNTRVLCGDLNESGPHRFICLNFWSPVYGRIRWNGFVGGGALLWGGLAWRFQILTHCQCAPLTSCLESGCFQLFLSSSLCSATMDSNHQKP